MSNKVHRTKGKEVIKHVKTVTIPYSEIIDVLNKDGEAFLEGPIKRQTVWYAAKKLSKALGQKVCYDRALLRIDGVDVLEGYSFALEDQPPQDQKDSDAH